MENNGNQYFETLNRFDGGVTEEALILRMKECDAIVRELAKSNAWQVLVIDVKDLIKTLDDNWQHIPPDSDKFESARIMKMACSFVADFPGKYLKELQELENKLKEIQNPQRTIQKDADPE